MAPRKRSRSSAQQYGRKRRQKFTSMKRSNPRLRTGGQMSLWQSSRKDELKYKDQTTNVLLDTSGISVINPNLNIVRGTADTERIGSRITLKSLQLNGWIRLTANAALTAINGSTMATIYIVLDKQANGATALFNDVFDSYNGLTLLDMSNRDRFSLLKKMVVPLYATAVDDTANVIAGPSKYFTCYQKMNVPIQYTSANTDGAVSGIQDNNIVVFANIAAADGTYTMFLQSRIRFQD